MAAIIRHTTLLLIFIFYPNSNRAQENDILSVWLAEIYPPEFFNKTKRGTTVELEDKEAIIAQPKECKCMPITLCDDNAQAVPEIHIRTSECDNYLDVCCKKMISPDRIKPQVSMKPPPNFGCGQRNPFGVGFRITENEDGEAQFGEFPWMVAILRGDPPTYQCGGSLIHPSVVLTAAHCVLKADMYTIRVGEWDTQTIQEVLPHQDVEVVTIVIHPTYNSMALYNDAALLFLKSHVKFAGNVGVVCLPIQGESFDYSRCLASGWGRENFEKEGVRQNIMKKVELPIVPSGKCEAILQPLLGRTFELHRSFICAGGEAGKDTCKGDGGSPLVCPVGDTGKYAQAGIVSWGVGCGDQDTPAVYTDVARLRYWIDDELEYRNVRIKDLRPKI